MELEDTAPLLVGLHASNVPYPNSRLPTHGLSLLLAGGLRRAVLYLLLVIQTYGVWFPLGMPQQSKLWRLSRTDHSPSDTVPDLPGGELSRSLSGNSFDQEGQASRNRNPFVGSRVSFGRLTQMFGSPTPGKPRSW